MNQEKRNEQELSGINPLIELLGGGDDVKVVTIKDMKGNEVSVSMELPATRQVKVTKHLFTLRDKLIGLNVKIPIKKKDESDDDYHLRVGTEMIGTMTEVLLHMVSDEVIFAAAEILGDEEAGDKYSIEELVVLVVPFFKRLFAKLMNRGGAVLNPVKESSSSGSASDGSSTPDSSPNGSGKTSPGEKSESPEPSSPRPEGS